MQIYKIYSYYKYLFPDTPILVGGIYASLMPNHCKEYTGCDDVIVGQIYEAEKLIPAFLKLSIQVISWFFMESYNTPSISKNTALIIFYPPVLFIILKKSSKRNFYMKLLKS